MQFPNKRLKKKNLHCCHIYKISTSSSHMPWQRRRGYVVPTAAVSTSAGGWLLFRWDHHCVRHVPPQTDNRTWPRSQAGAHSLLWLSLSETASRCRWHLLHKWLLLAKAAEIPAGRVRRLITTREGSLWAANFSRNLCPHLAALLPCARCSGKWALASKKAPSDSLMMGKKPPWNQPQRQAMMAGLHNYCL